jgi:hypothetical protein
MNIHALRQNLPPLPERMKHLPLNHQGFPVPWFVAWFENGKPCDPGRGEPDFRVIDTPKLGTAVRQKRCWVCGGFLGRHLAFVIGPMCAINRVISEPPSHLECAIFSATACPFLSQPRMRRDEKDLPDGKAAAGFGIKCNPGVACVWVTRSYRVFRPQAGAPGVLFQLGEPEEVLWFAHGRAATREEVVASIDSGYPALLEIAAQEGSEAVRALDQHRKRAMPLLPKEVAHDA